MLLALVALPALLGAVEGAAADATRPPAGAAARSTDVPLVPRKTREELLREWDLNADGKIDTGEAEVAASRMRLERATVRLNSGFDPVTGRPRDEAEPGHEPIEEEERDSDLAAELEAATPPPRKKPPASPTTSGTRSPGGAALFPAQRPLPMTGGVRAGAQAARPGYGASPAPSLNAGRPLPTARPTTASRPLNAAASAQQPAGVSGGAAMPATAGGAATQRPRGGLLPRPPLQPPPRSRDLYDPY